MFDLKYVLRSLRRSPGYALTIILTLALGIGANTAIFSLTYGILLKPLPYEEGEELVLLEQYTEGTQAVPISIAEFFDYRREASQIDLVEYHRMNFTLLGGEEPQRVSTGVVSHNFFDLLGVDPLHGRFFLESDEQAGAEAVLLLSYPFFQRAFGGDKGVVGEVFQLNDRPHTVVGVLPPMPPFPNDNDIYMPTIACPFRAFGQQQMHENRRAFSALLVLGRMHDGVAPEAATTEVHHLAERFAVDHPADYEGSEELGARVVPLSQELTRGAAPMLLVLLATTGLVLLLACSNVANLILSRSLARRREWAVRAALGAPRWRLARQSVAEAVLLALCGGVLGVALAAFSLDLLKSFAEDLSPRAAQVELDGVVLLFAVALAVLTGTLFGAAPILPGRLQLQRALRQGSPTGGGRQAPLRAGLVVFQVALSTVLLVGAGLLLRSFDQLQKVDPGYNPERVLTAQVALNWSVYDDPEKVRTFFRRTLEELRGNPAVVSAAVGSVAPLTRQGGNTQGVRIQGRPAEEGLQPALDTHFVSAGYFETLEIPVLLGRAFDSRDHAESAPVAVINAATAQRFWPGGDALGQHLSLDDGENWLRVVGVVGDVRHYALDQRALEELYLPMEQVGFSNRIVVRTRGEPEAAAQDVRRAVWSVDPQQPVDRVSTLEANRNASLTTPRTTTWLLTLFAALALAISGAGIAGMVAWSVGQRVREIGIRMALGARPGSVLTMVFRQGLALVGGGLVLGLVAAYFFSNLLADLLFQVEPFDLLTLVGVVVVFLSIGALACLSPARRAVAVDPNVAVRTE